MKQEIINDLNIKFANKHSHAQNIAYQNVLRAQANPNFLALDKQIKTLTFSLGKEMALCGNNIEKLRAQKKLAQKQQVEILQNMGLEPSDLLPNYSCKKCNDTGRINGKFCDCYKRELYALLLEKSGAKTSLANFDEFDDNLGTEQQCKQLKKIKTFFMDWTKNFPTVSNHLILLSGKTGVGKTFLTECVANSLMKKGQVVSFVSSTQLGNMFLKYHIAPNTEKLDHWQMLTEPDLLVIDDLGTEPLLKNVTIPYLCALLNDRFSSSKATIISTNLSPDQILSHYGDRIFSRIANKSDSKMFKIEGNDLRLKAH